MSFRSRKFMAENIKFYLTGLHFLSGLKNRYITHVSVNTFFFLLKVNFLGIISLGPNTQSVLSQMMFILLLEERNQV